MFVRVCVRDGEGRRRTWMAVTPFISHPGSVPLQMSIAEALMGWWCTRRVSRAADWYLSA